MIKKILFVIFCGLLLSNIVYAGVDKHTYKKGETLWELSEKYYGDPTFYLLLAEINEVNPKTIKNGKELIIPSKKDIQKLSEEKDEYKRDRLIEKITGKKIIRYNGKYEDRIDKNSIPSLDNSSLDGMLDCVMPTGSIDSVATNTHNF